MNEDWSRRQEYYRKIARTFLKHQPSAFFLPPRDLDLISQWERLNLPLEVIIEGIDRTFSRRVTGRRKKNIYSLSQCEKEIMKAYAQHQERQVGLQIPRAMEQSEKVGRVLREVSTCLESLPVELSPVRKILEEASEALMQNPPDGDRLEALDEELDRVLWDLTPEAEQEESLLSARREYPGRADSDLEEIRRTLVAREKRLQYKIPHLALFYY